MTDKPGSKQSTRGKQQRQAGRPSQAEGDRETVEQDLNDRTNQQAGHAASGQREDLKPPRPSQAEGDRETVEQDLERRQLERSALPRD
jgi:hypothetical protein